MRGAVLSLVAYCAVALALFGSLLKPLVLLTLWADRMDGPWLPIVGASAAVTGTIFLVPARRLRTAGLGLPLFVVVWMLLSVLFVGIYADRARQSRLAAFHADASFQHSFLRSLREAPAEPQFYLHAAALKNCAAHAWSYRTMGFYPLPPDVAKNVLPPEWIARCATPAARPA